MAKKPNRNRLTKATAYAKIAGFVKAADLDKCPCSLGGKVQQKEPATDHVIVKIIVLWTLIIAMIATTIFTYMATGKFNGLQLMFVIAAALLFFDLFVTQARYDLGFIEQYRKLGYWINRRFARLIGYGR